jgi:hypothetical protein
MGFAGAALWVLERNIRARGFYERDGWRRDGTLRAEIIGGTAVDEVRYRRGLI